LGDEQVTIKIIIPTPKNPARRLSWIRSNDKKHTVRSDLSRHHKEQDAIRPHHN